MPLEAGPKLNGRDLCRNCDVLADGAGQPSVNHRHLREARDSVGCDSLVFASRRRDRVVAWTGSTQLVSARRRAERRYHLLSLRLMPASDQWIGSGGRSRTRTYGPLIKSQLLYQLSYAPAGPSTRIAGPIASTPRIAKTGDCKGRCLPRPAIAETGDCQGRRLTHILACAHVSSRQTAGRPLQAGLARRAEESPGSTGIRCRPTAGGGDPRESATENKPPAFPRFVRGAAGKGEMVRQERTAPLATGAAGQTPPGARPNRGGRRHGTKPHFAPWPRRRSRLVVRVGRVRRTARCVPEEWSSRAAQGTSNGETEAVRTEPGLQAVWRYRSTERNIFIHRLVHEVARKNKTKTSILARKDHRTPNYSGPPPTR